jgi:hypothetical protein
MPIKKNYLNSKLKGSGDDNITPFNDNNLDKLLSDNEDFNNGSGKA